MDSTLFYPLKKAVTFYEQQMPFGFRGYIRNMPISEKRGIVRALPDFVWGKYSRLKTIKNLVRSFIQSGRKANGIQVK